MALAASVLALCGLAAPASAEIVTVNYTIPGTGNLTTAVFNATQQGATNIYDLSSVVDYFVNGVSVKGAPYNVVSQDFLYGLSASQTASVALDGSFADYRLYNNLAGAYGAVGSATSALVGRDFIDADVAFGGNGNPGTFDPANFSAHLGAPGAPAPLLGLGLLPALAGIGGLAATRRRRRKDALSPAFA